MSLPKRLVPLLSCIALLPAVAWAQTPDAGTIQQEQQRTLQYYDLQRRLQAPAADDEPLIDDQTTRPKPAQPPTAEVRVQVNRIVVGPSEKLSRAEIEAVTAPYTGRDVTIRELFDAVAALNRLYRDKACVTCQAFLPPQKVEDGTVEIRLVEGRLGEVRVVGATAIRDGWILDRIRQKPGDILDTGALERDLAFINATNDLRTSANLKPGKTFGTVDAEILTQEPARFGLTVFGDNAGREEIGRTRLGLVFNARNVFGRSDPLTVSATGADGTAGGSIAYSLPITTFGTRLGLQYDASAIDIRRGPFAALDITGTASNAGIQLIQPLVGTLTRKVNFFVGYNTKDSITKFGGTPVTRADTRNISIGVDAQGFSATDFWYTRHAVTIGTTQWGGDQDFVKYNADALWSRSHDNGLVTQLRGSVQLTSNQQIPTFEQFFVGGMATVRGYQEGVLIGPRGWFASGELQFPLWSSPNRPAGAPLGDRLRGVMFLDHGAAVPASSSGQTLDWKHTLWSTGFGLLYNFSRFCSGRIMLGLPLADRSPAQDDWVVHAYVQSIVF